MLVIYKASQWIIVWLVKQCVLQSFKIIRTLNLHEAIAVIGEIVMSSCKISQLESDYAGWSWSWEASLNDGS